MDIEDLRRQVIGRNAPIATPFGVRPLIYADYTASGRALRNIESEVLEHLSFYANSHSEHTLLGEKMRGLQEEADRAVRAFVNAGPRDHVLFCGNGATGALKKLQEILGIFVPNQLREATFGDETRRPLVFVGPYEHHSNDLPWRHGRCDVERIPFEGEEGISLQELESRLESEAKSDAPRRSLIGAFSAASNITGLRTDVHAIAALLHRFGAYAVFDFAAAAPYEIIDMNHGDETYFDAIFFSPHKFLGGPQSSGVLVVKEHLYRRDGPPSFPSGGTVNYVILNRESYVEDIERRESGGTPGHIQNWRAARALSLREELGAQRIEMEESASVRLFEDRMKSVPNYISYGPPYDPSRRLPILAFNLGYNDLILHPHYVARLLGDLFGIQVRGGCFCASPYVFHLFHYKCIQSNLFSMLDKTGAYGLKLGAVRLDLHYTLTRTEVEYIAKAVEFIARNGHRLLPLYVFDLKDGSWKPLKHDIARLSLALPALPLGETELTEPWVAGQFSRLEAWARSLDGNVDTPKLPPREQEHVYFPFVHFATGRLK